METGGKRCWDRTVGMLRRTKKSIHAQENTSNYTSPKHDTSFRTLLYPCKYSLVHPRVPDIFFRPYRCDSGYSEFRSFSFLRKSWATGLQFPPPQDADVSTFRRAPSVDLLHCMETSTGRHHYAMCGELKPSK